MKTKEEILKKWQQAKVDFCLPENYEKGFADGYSKALEWVLENSVDEVEQCQV